MLSQPISFIVVSKNIHLNFSDAYIHEQAISIENMTLELFQYSNEKGNLFFHITGGRVTAICCSARNLKCALQNGNSSKKKMKLH